jgi:hypothetical protein
MCPRLGGVVRAHDRQSVRFHFRAAAEFGCTRFVLRFDGFGSPCSIPSRCKRSSSARSCSRCFPRCQSKPLTVRLYDDKRTVGRSSRQRRRLSTGRTPSRRTQSSRRPPPLARRLARPGRWSAPSASRVRRLAARACTRRRRAAQGPDCGGSLGRQSEPAPKRSVRLLTCQRQVLCSYALDHTRKVDRRHRRRA